MRGDVYIYIYVCVCVCVCVRVHKGVLVLLLLTRQTAISRNTLLCACITQLKPVNVGGVAGGEKYICQGILFKFAIDFQGLYLGDENAMKVAQNLCESVCESVWRICMWFGSVLCDPCVDLSLLCSRLCCLRALVSFCLCLCTLSRAH
jgi:hypothetical protein